MFIYNVKVNKSNSFKFFLAILAIICLSIFIVGIFKMVDDMDKSVENMQIEDELLGSDVAQLTSENYTNILKAVHDNLDQYMGSRISFSGYVYRVPGLNEDEFILARDMNLNNSQTVVVGFLCKLEHASEFENYTWVNIVGTIEKGELNGNIPIVKINQIERVEKPENALVKLPDDTYIPTNALDVK